MFSCNAFTLQVRLTNPFIPGISISRRTFKYLHMVNTTYCIHVRPKKYKNSALARQTMGPTERKLGMYTQLDPCGNMGWVPPGQTSYGRVRLKMQQKKVLPIHLDLLNFNSITIHNYLIEVLITEILIVIKSVEI